MYSICYWAEQKPQPKWGVPMQQFPRPLTSSTNSSFGADACCQCGADNNEPSIAKLLKADYFKAVPVNYET